VALALGAMPVAAGAVQYVVQPALLAAVDDAAVLLGTAQEDGVDHLPVLRRHGFTETAQIDTVVSDLVAQGSRRISLALKREST
jgi:hypothetical protein